MVQLSAIQPVIELNDRCKKTAYFKHSAIIDNMGVEFLFGGFATDNLPR